jgi:hypothetical protein
MDPIFDCKYGTVVRVTEVFVFIVDQFCWRDTNLEEIKFPKFKNQILKRFSVL